MSWFCKHEPEIIARTYSPPIDLSSLKTAEGPDARAFVERALMGVTTVLVRCQKCGRIWQYDMLGKEAAE